MQLAGKSISRFIPEFLVPRPSAATTVTNRKNSDPSTLERASLLTTPSKTPGSTESTKGRCWCCWETSETASDPLIRVCKGCKDPDLQWIHQSCVNSFITALPTSPAVLPRPQMDENGNAVMIQALAVGEPDIIMGHGLAAFDFDVGILHAAAAAAATAQPTTFRCTRCNDPYTVIETEIPRFKVVSQDPHLRSAFLVMFVCMVIITTCSISILQDHWGTDRLIFDFQCCSSKEDESSGGSSIGGGGGVRIKLHTTVFSGLILVVSWWFAVETCWMIWIHAGGRMNRKVIGVS